MKKGFTLLELLAVIIVLSILLVITIPVLISTINDSEKKSIELSAQRYVEGLSKEILSKDLISNLDPILCTIDDEGLMCDGIKVEYKASGKTPKSGIVGFNKGEVVGYSLCMPDYKVIKNRDGVSSKKTAGCTAYDINKVPASLTDTHKGIVYFDPSDLSKECTEELASENLNDKNPQTPTEITSGCMKFYIYNDEGDYYKLLLDHNTTGSIPWNSKGTNKKMGEVAVALAKDTTGWVGNPRLITAQEIAHIVGTDVALKWDERKPIGRDPNTQVTMYYFDGSGTTYYSSEWQNSLENSGIKSKYSWLYNYTTDCLNYGCDIDDSHTYPTVENPDACGSHGYWTSSPAASNTTNAWRVSRMGMIDQSGNGAVTHRQYYGVRPVITLPKYIFEQ